MESEPATNPIKQVRTSIFINAALAIYAIGTFIGTLKTGEAWRIVLSGIGSVFFLAVVVTLLLKLNKLRKSA